PRRARPYRLLQRTDRLRRNHPWRPGQSACVPGAFPLHQPGQSGGPALAQERAGVQYRERRCCTPYVRLPLRIGEGQRARPGCRRNSLDAADAGEWPSHLLVPAGGAQPVAVEVAVSETHDAALKRASAGNRVALRPYFDIVAHDIATIAYGVGTIHG